ncbi:MAG: YceK/YidQ family lipoprotein [Nevskia sp.]|nr:YceK/YidQ family lipoprotein [Nevskia sp.]
MAASAAPIRKGTASSLATLALVAALSGCATIEATEADCTKCSLVAYAGTRLDVAALSHDGEALERFERAGVSAPAYPALDLPFSFALDSVILFAPRDLPGP